MNGNDRYPAFPFRRWLSEAPPTTGPETPNDGWSEALRRALPPEAPAIERERTGAFFAFWAICRQPASAREAAEILSEPESMVQERMENFRVWLAPSEKENRLLCGSEARLALLRRLPPDALATVNRAFVGRCRSALTKNEGGFWETYALEHFHEHLFADAHRDPSSGNELIGLCRDRNLRARRAILGKGYGPSKQAAETALNWAAEHRPDSVADCALEVFEVSLLQLNPAAEIVQMAAANDVEKALAGIETAGENENDADSLQTKFFLYMLCLMELTLLSGRDKPYRREAIETILRHFGQHIPVAHDRFTWNGIFPGYLAYRMACEWSRLGLDFLAVFKRTDAFDFDWIRQKKRYGTNAFRVLIRAVATIQNSYSRLEALDQVLLKLSERGQAKNAFDLAMQTAQHYWRFEPLLGDILGELAVAEGSAQGALKCARRIEKPDTRAEVLCSAAQRLHVRNLLEEARRATEEALQVARSMDNDFASFEALKTVASELARQNRLDEAVETIAEARERLSQDTNEEDGFPVLDPLAKDQWAQIAVQLAVRGFVEGALWLVDGLDMDFVQERTRSDISLALTKIGKIEQALAAAHRISGHTDRALALLRIGRHRLCGPETAQACIREALSTVKLIHYGHDKATVLILLSDVQARLGRPEEAVKALQKALEFVDDTHWREEIYTDMGIIAVRLAALGRFDAAIAVADQVDLPDWQKKTRCRIAAYCAHRRQFENATAAIQKNIRPLWQNTWLDRNQVLREIAAKLNEENRFDDSVAINDQESNFEKAAEWLAKRGKIEEAVAMADKIARKNSKAETLLYIAQRVAEQGNTTKAISLVSDTVQLLQDGSGFLENESEDPDDPYFDLEVEVEFQRFSSWRHAVDLLVQYKNFEEAERALLPLEEQMLENIDPSSQSSDLQYISSVWYRLQDPEKAAEILFLASIAANEQTDGWNRLRNLLGIASELAEQGNPQAASTLLRELSKQPNYSASNESVRYAQGQIARAFAKLGLEREAISSALEIADPRYRQSTLLDLAEILTEKIHFDAGQKAVRLALDLQQGVDSSVYVHFNSLFKTAKTFGLANKAEALIQKSLQDFQEISEPAKKADALYDLYYILKYTKDEEAAKKMLRVAEETAETLQGYHKKEFLLDFLRREWKDWGNEEEANRFLKKAVEAASAMPQGYSAHSRRAELAGILARNGQWPEAAALLSQIAERSALLNGLRDLKRKIAQKEGGQRPALIQIEQNLETPLREAALAAWAEDLAPQDADTPLMATALPLMAGTPEALCSTLRKHVLHRLFFEKCPSGNIRHLIEALDLQWAADRADQLPTGHP